MDDDVKVLYAMFTCFFAIILVGCIANAVADSKKYACTQNVVQAGFKGSVQDIKELCK